MASNSSRRISPLPSFGFAAGALAAIPVVCTAAVGLGWTAISSDGVTYLAAARTFLDRLSLPATYTQAPPGFPCTLALLLACGGELPIVAARVLAAIALAVTIILTALLYRAALGARGALLVAAGVAISSLLIESSWRLLSDVPFLAVLLLALWAIDRAAGRDAPHVWRAALIAAAAVSAATMIRSVGLLLIPAGAFAIWRRGVDRPSFIRRAQPAILFALTAAVLPAAWSLSRTPTGPRYDYWHILTQPRPSEQTRAAGIALWSQRVVDNLPRRLDQLCESLCPRTIAWSFWSGPFGRPVAIVVGLLAMTAVARRWAREQRAEDAFVLLNFAVLVIWPWDEGTRLLIPLVPLAWGAIVAAVQGAYHRAGAAGRLRAALVAPLLALALLQLSALAHALRLADGSRSRAIARIARAERLAAQAFAVWPADVPIVALVPRGCDDKTDAALAGYLARRRVELLDWTPDAPAPQPNCTPADLLVHEDAVGALLDAPAAPARRVGRFLFVSPWDRSTDTRTEP